MNAELLARGGRKLTLGDTDHVVFYDLKSLKYFEAESGLCMAEVLTRNLSVSPLSQMLRAGLLHEREYSLKEMDQILEDVFEKWGIGALQGAWQVIAAALLKRLPKETEDAADGEEGKKPKLVETSGKESSDSPTENSDSPPVNSGD